MSKALKWVVGGVVVALVSGGAAWAGRGGSAPGGPSPGASIASALEQRGGPHPILAHLAEGRLDLVYEGREHLVTLVHGRILTVSSTALTVRELNGKRVTVAVNDRTRVRRNRKSAHLSDLQPGDVAFTFQEGSAPARLVIAFDPREAAAVST